ncbi:MAG: fasciclin domain-containing protein [Gemmatimonadota bacterium]|nr:fasciclin domain-containing protein [Gemmatimonadota bacterium]
MLVATPARAQMMDHSARSNTIVDVAVGAGFNTLVAAVKAAGLADALSGTGPFTVFAPTDAAFAKLPAGTVEALLKDPVALAAILKYHVVSGKVTAADVIKSNGGKTPTLNGAALDIQVKGGKVHVNGATVTSADVMASNGVIHVIDTVVLPPTAK